jgi:hypothetical protein
MQQKQETALTDIQSKLKEMNQVKVDLTDLEQSIDLIRLCEFSPNDKWSLLYRGTRDGFDVQYFHSKCDGHSNTLKILKAKQSSYIFGSFTSVSWESPANGIFKSDANAFIFCFTNKEKRPGKMNIDPNQHDFAIRCDSECGPSFGGGCDIDIADDSILT